MKRSCRASLFLLAGTSNAGACPLDQCPCACAQQTRTQNFDLSPNGVCKGFLQNDRNYWIPFLTLMQGDVARFLE
jgi:hypothetical protein